MPRRRLAGLAWTAFGAFSAGLASGLLVLVTAYVALKGLGGLNAALFLQTPRPPGMPGGGLGNGIVGTAIIIGLAALAAAPLGLGTGIYLATYGRGPLAEALRLLNDVVAGIPGIAVGLVAYDVLVAPLGHFSAFSASAALAILMLPPIVRTSEAAFAAIPREIREGAVALGFTRFTMLTRLFFPLARPLLATGMVLAIARVCGETAPLLFTAFGSQFWELNPANPMAELSLQVFTYAISPYNDWHAMAWAGALILIVAVFGLNLAARLAAKPVAKLR